MGSVRYIGSTQKRGRAFAVLLFSLSFSRAISFLSMASLFVRTPYTLSDASCSADQRDFCLKHDLSLKYLKPDYLWVCHLGRRDVTRAGQWQDPSLLSSLPPFFSPRAMRLCRWNPTPLNSLYERETLSRPLCPSRSYLLPSSSIDQEHPTIPLECNEIWHVPYITADILLSFGHTFLESGAIEDLGLPPPSLFLSFFLCLSSRLFIFFTSLQRCYLQW